MTAEQERMIVAMAHRVLAEDSPSTLRREWANDVLAWLDMGDMAAAMRCGFEPPARPPTLTLVGGTDA
jgi:hypothetical protein